MSNRFLKIFFCIVASLILSACATKPLPPKGEVLPQISLNDTAGKWYEIGAVPKLYTDCFCSYAVYKPEQDFVKASSYCRQKSVTGPERSADVLFYPIKGSHNARYVVKFNWLFSGDFWIVYVDEQDNTAIIATPNKKHFWMIARTPTVSKQTYQKMYEFLQQKGYPVSKIRLTDQSCWVKKTG